MLQSGKTQWSYLKDGYVIDMVSIWWATLVVMLIGDANIGFPIVVVADLTLLSLEKSCC
jgi:hypothetical protein